MADLFFFGTLRDADLFERVVGRPMAEFTVTDAFLAGYSVLRTELYPFPTLVPDTLGEAPGIIVSGFTEAEVERIAYYETNEYDLYEVTVRVGLAEFVTAGAFFGSEHLYASQKLWSIDAWAATAKQRALIEAEIAMAHFGSISRDEVNDHWPEFERLASEVEAERFGLPRTA